MSFNLILMNRIQSLAQDSRTYIGHRKDNKILPYNHKFSNLKNLSNLGEGEKKRTAKLLASICHSIHSIPRHGPNVCMAESLTETPPFSSNLPQEGTLTNHGRCYRLKIKCSPQAHGFELLVVGGNVWEVMETFEIRILNGRNQTLRDTVLLAFFGYYSLLPDCSDVRSHLMLPPVGAY